MSTSSAIASFVNNILEAQDGGEEVLGIFYDYSKAFDTVNHNILLHKLNMLGISGVANSWISTYLKDRKQTVHLTNNAGCIKSDEVTMNCGLPQGSILSPLLFILFINDLAHYSQCEG